jgi:hypothetical protein
MVHTGFLSKKTVREEAKLKDIGIDGRTVLKQIFNDTG